MLNTVQDIFDIAIRLIDAQNESTGSTKTADTKEYELRTPSLLNSILDRAYPASDTYAAAQEAAERLISPTSAIKPHTVVIPIPLISKSLSI